MAISETMSNPNEWMQFYQTSLYDDSVNSPPPQPAPAASRSNTLNPDHGRISKPLRRRSRASRRTPTTLFNTDTANFRAMVQQFTGAPLSQLPNSTDRAGGGVAFGFDVVGTQSAAEVAPANGFQVQYAANQQQRQQQMFTIGGGVSLHAQPDQQDFSRYML